MTDIPQMESLLSRGRDSALLRFGLGKAYLDQGDAARAVEHLRCCTERDPAYAAAWKLLGKAHLALGEEEAARQAWEQGVAAAQAGGHVQAEKEMRVFLRRLARGA